MGEYGWGWEEWWMKTYQVICDKCGEVAIGRLKTDTPAWGIAAKHVKEKGDGHKMRVVSF